MVKKEVVEILKKYIMLLNEEGISVNKAFLFGSYADNSADEMSDIDVLIVSDKYDESNDIAVGMAWKLTKKISTRIEPYLIGVKKFTGDESSPLINLIKSKGIEIV
jgi:predicted nucleotidyltransferase